MSRRVAMTIGELTGYIDLEDKGFGAELDKAGRALDRLQSTTSSKTASMESTVSRGMADIEKAIADGMDPAEAIADLDRLEKELDQALADMVADAGRFAAELGGAIELAYGQLDDEAGTAGRRAGDELVDGFRAGLRDAERVARNAGDDAGRGFGDGVEDSAGGGGGGRMGKLGVNLVGGLKAGALGVALAAGAAIGAALMSGLEKALDADKAKAKLAAQLGTLGPESERIGKVAGGVFADAYGESMSDVTDAIRAVIQNMDGMRDASDQALGDTTKRAMDVASVLGEDVNRVTAAVAQILRNDLAPNAEAAFDLLIRGAQEGVNKSEDLLDTFNEYSTQFRELGLTGKQALGLLSQGLQAGARDADTVADALKEFAIRAQDGSDTSRAAFEDIGLNANKMFRVFAEGGEPAQRALGDVLDRIRGIPDPVKRSEVAVALFGTKAEDLQDALYALDPATAVDAIGQVEGAAKAAGDTLHNTAIDRLTAFKRGLEENVVSFLDSRVLPALDGFAAWFSDGPISGALSSLGEEFGTLWSDLTSGVTDWMAENEETVAAIQAVYEETFTAIIELVSEFVSTVTEFWNEWGDTIMSVVSVVVQTVVANIGGWLTALKGIFQTIKAVLTGDWEAAWEGIKNIAEGATRGIRTAIEAGLRELLAAMGRSWDDMKAAAKQKLDDLVANVKNLPANLKSIASAAKTWLVQAGKDLINGMINGVRQKAAELANAARDTVSNAVKSAKNFLGISSPSKVFQNIGLDTIQGFIGGLVEKGKDLVSTATAVVGSAVTAAKTTTGTGGGGGGSGQPSTVMHEIGKLTVQGLIAGLTGESGKAVDTVKNLVAQIKDAFASQPDVVDGLLKFVSVGNDSLSALAKQREELVERLANAKEMAKQVAGTAQEWAEITGLDPKEFTGGADLAQELMNRASAINNFANNIQELARRGLNKAVLQQIIDAGVEKGATFAEMLVGSDGSEIKALNKAQKQVEKASKKLGKVSADAMYDTGKKAGEGYLKGLQDSLKKLDKEMEKIVKSLVSAIKKHLKIKSPSQVMAEIGQYSMEGLIVGMDSMASQVVAAAEQITQQAVTAAQAAAGAAAKGAGMVAGSLPGAPAAALVNGQAASVGLGIEGQGVAWEGSRQQQPAVNVNIQEAVIREEADFAKIGSAVTFAVMGRGVV